MRKYSVVFRMQVKSARAYVLNLLFSALCVAVPLFGVLLFWRALFQDPQVRIAGYGQSDIMAYYLITRLIGDAVSSEWWEIGENIREGRLHLFILKPLDYVGYYFSQMLGANLMTIVVTSVVLAPLTCILTAKGYFAAPSPSTLLLFSIAVAGGIALGFLIGMAFQLCAFWLGETSGLNNLRYLLTTLLMGAYFPLDFLGPRFASVLTRLPFSYQLYFPAKLFLGQLDRNSALAGLAWQWGWVAVTLAIVRLIWKQGIRRYESVGG